jgi:hypothetical protein
MVLKIIPTVVRKYFEPVITGNYLIEPEMHITYWFTKQ